MDLYGREPTAEVGQYFYINRWWWHPLWTYITHTAPWVLDKVPAGYWNQGDGLDAVGTRALVALLDEELRSGYTERYSEALSEAPPRPCSVCRGSGVSRCARSGAHSDAEPATTKLFQTEPDGEAICVNCEGRGVEPPPPFTVENVREFRDFRAASGGFEIW